MDPHDRLCVYVHLQGKKKVGSVHGFLYSTRQDAVAHVKKNVPSLSSVQDGRLLFSIEGAVMPDDPAVWKALTASTPTGATVVVRVIKLGVNAVSDRANKKEASTTSASFGRQPNVPFNSATGEKRAREDVDASDGDAGGSSPEHDDPPIKKKAKLVKEKQAKLAAAKKGQSSISDPEAMSTNSDDARDQTQVRPAITSLSLLRLPPPLASVGGSISSHDTTSVSADSACPSPTLSSNVRKPPEQLKIGCEASCMEILWFAIFPQTPLGKLFSAAMHHHRTPGCRDIVHFEYQGGRLGEWLTPAEVGLETGQIITALHEQIGGKPVIYIYPPKEMDVACKLTLSPDWSFSAVYPQVEEKLLADGGQSVLWRARVDESGQMKMLAGQKSNGNVESGLEVSYLYWEAITNATQPASPPSSPHLHAAAHAIVPFDPTIASLDHPATVLLPINELTAYLDRSLQALGLHTEGRTSFITYWLPSFLKHRHVLLRFVPQATYALAAKIELDPPVEVETRIFLVFQGITADKASDAELDMARTKANASDFEAWRDEVGVPSRERQEDASLLRIVEWGGMEVFGH